MGLSIPNGNMEKHISQAALKPLRHVELDVLKASASLVLEMY